MKTGSGFSQLPSVTSNLADLGVNWEEVAAQFAAANERGLMLVGARRRVLELNDAARAMVSYQGPLPRPLDEVVRDVNVGFAVGDALHDRRPVWHEAYTLEPERLLRFHVVPILAETGEPVVAVVAIDDVTRLRHLETVRRDFVANVSHELRTPIASINLLVETLQHGAVEDPTAAAQFLQRIQIETQSMAKLVEELLELTRLESGTITLAIQPMDLKALLEDVVNRLAPAAREKAVAVQVGVQEPLAQVAADPKRIEQVVMNLVHNAIKFTPSGGEVAVRAARQGRGVEVEVADTGVGMDAAQANRIFERFYKVDRGRNRAEGVGLGLAIARHLLQLHGSELRVVSEVGRGSRFSFALPVAD